MNVVDYAKKIPFLLMLPRFYSSTRIPLKHFGDAVKWTFVSRETSTLTYPLRITNRKYLIHTASLVAGVSYAEIEKYFLEIESNQELTSSVIKGIELSGIRHKKDLRCDFGSRIAWYAIIRAMKSRVVVENGVEMGLTGVALCEALLRNQSEGYPGAYIGLDINPDAGCLVRSERYLGVATLQIRDALESIDQLSHPVDFYFSDGLRTAEYEKEEFERLSGKLADNAVVISNKLKFSDVLADCSLQWKKRFVTFQEEPLNHWYPGSLFGIVH
jgi:hypothetical protein